MISITDKTKCCGCHACANICPKHCIEMVYDDEGFLYPKVDKEKCINCGLCEKICPILKKEKTKEKKSEKKIPLSYAMKNKNLEVRMKSSSGGIFSLLAEYILSQNGVVFGAGFDKNFKVVHTKIDKVEDIDKLRISKYVQSEIGDTYKQAKDLLNEGKTVLFTGTPCQIGGLLSYLGKGYPNLYTQDLICHGVPSPKVWEKYVEYREKEANCKVEKITFRKKIENHKKTAFSISFENNVEYCKYPNYKDPMMKFFFFNKCLRPSCHKCAFKRINRPSDITLADFWGINGVVPKMNDGKGVSLVLIHSEKGKKLFEEIKNKTDFCAVDFYKAIKHNPMIKRSTLKSYERSRFMRDFKKLPFEKVVKKYGSRLF